MNIGGPEVTEKMPWHRAIKLHEELQKEQDTTSSVCQSFWVSNIALRFVLLSQGLGNMLCVPGMPFFSFVSSFAF